MPVGKDMHHRTVWSHNRRVRPAVHKLDPEAMSLRSCPATYMSPNKPTALMCIPLLCSQEAICAMLLHESGPIFDTWVHHAQTVVGALLVTVHPNRTATPERLDACTANALILANMLGPLVVERAEQRLLQAAFACDALPSDVPLHYEPGEGFVVHGSSSNASISTRLLNMLEQPCVVADLDDASSVDSSGAEVSSVHDEPSDVDGRQGKRRRCQQDAHFSVSRNDSSEDEDDYREAVSSCRRRKGEAPAASSSGPSEGSSSGALKHSPH